MDYTKNFKKKIYLNIVGTFSKYLKILLMLLVLSQNNKIFNLRVDFEKSCGGKIRKTFEVVPTLFKISKHFPKLCENIKHTSFLVILYLSEYKFYLGASVGRLVTNQISTYIYIKTVFEKVKAA